MDAPTSIREAIIREIDSAIEQSAKQWPDAIDVDHAKRVVRETLRIRSVTGPKGWSDGATGPSGHSGVIWPPKLGFGPRGD